MISGESILETGQLSGSNSGYVLAEGMPQTNSPWLSQVIFAATSRFGAGEALSGLRSLFQFGCFAVLGFAIYRSTRSRLLAVLAVAFLFAVAWPQLAVLRPLTISAFCFATLLFLNIPDERRRSDLPRQSKLSWLTWAATPLLILVWANVDSTVVVGVLYLFALALGRAIDVFYRCGWRSVPRDAQTRKRMLLAEVGLVASCLQPQGAGLWLSFFGGLDSAWWMAIGGYRPLMIPSWNGIAFVATWVITLLVFRRSQTRIRGSEILLLGFGSLTIFLNESMTFVILPAMVLALMPRVAEITKTARQTIPTNFRLIQKKEDVGENPPFKFALTLVCLLVLWCGFALSPASRPLLGGKPRVAEQLYGKQTPIETAQFLKAQPVAGLTWAPDRWSDWLAWDLADDAQLFIGSEKQHFPAQVRHDYGVVERGLNGWDRILDRYGVETIVASKADQPDLIEKVRKAATGWIVVYEDEQSLVFRRRIGSNSNGKGEAA